MTTYKITAKVSATTGNQLVHNGTSWKLFTDVNQYGKEPKLADKKVDQLLAAGSISRVNHEPNLAARMLKSYTYVFN